MESDNPAHEQGDGRRDDDDERSIAPNDTTSDQRHGHGITPPYWHHRSRDSNVSLELPAPITLEDHEIEASEESGALWAKSVTIDDWVVVSGSGGGGGGSSDIRGGGHRSMGVGVGAYVVYICVVEIIDGTPMTIRKRYSEFDVLRKRLIQTFPHSEAAMPDLPPKSFIWRTHPRFLNKRRIGLSYFLNCVLLNPEFASAPVLKEFIFS